MDTEWKINRILKPSKKDEVSYHYDYFDENFLTANG